MQSKPTHISSASSPTRSPGLHCSTLELCHQSDATHHRGWLTPENMQMLGDDPRADQIILTRQHYKSKAVRGDVKKAFE